MRDLIQRATDHGDAMQRASLALQTLADLVGADGSEHHLSDSEKSGLKQAIYVVGCFLWGAGIELWELGDKCAAELDAKEGKQ